MSLLVVGSVAIDSIESPRGVAPDILGGSATHFAMAASYFAPVRLVGVVGEDFPDAFIDALRERDVDLAGLEVLSGRSFRWSGRYEGSMASAETLSVELNLLGTFDPKLPESYRQSRYVFLANGSPKAQRRVMEQVEGDAYYVLDTMNLWIELERRAVVDLLGEIDALVVNDGELRQLTGESNLITAGREVQGMGPRTLIVKKGEHGALLFHEDRVFAAPAYPVGGLVDPTGAGDSFAGGLLGTIAQAAERDGGRPSFDTLRRAVCAGIVTASFNVEDFGINRLRALGADELLARYRDYMAMLRVDGEPALSEPLVSRR